MGSKGERTRRWGAAASLFLLLGLAFPTAAAAPLEGQSDPTGAAGADDDGPAADPRSLGELYAGLAELRQAELRKSLDELWAVDPARALDVVVLRAGRETPPILTGPRRAARETLRAEAIRWIVERTEADPAERGRLVARLGELIRGEAGRESLACAAMLLAGDLRMYELAGTLAGRLGAGRPDLRAAARAALFDLYLEWFQDAAHFEAFEARNRGKASGELFYETSERYEDLARKRLIELIELDPQRAVSGLDELDPRVRAAAARATARAMAAARLEKEAGARRLLQRLAVEEDATAYHAILDALLGALSDAPPDAPIVREARLALVSAIPAGHPGQQAPIASALARLPWAAGKEPATDSVLRGIEFLDQQLRERILADELVDRDVIVVSLRALQGLCGVARDAGLDPTATVPGLHDVVLARLEDPGELESVRVAAALLLPSFVRDGDALRVIAVLEGAERRPELAYAAVGALGEMARGMPPADPVAEAILDTLAGVVARDGADLRRRALGYLLEGALADRVAASDPSLFVEWLRGETLPELQTSLLARIARSGSAADLDALLAMDSFDALVRRGPGRVGEVAAVLKALAPGDADRVMRSAERIVAIDDKATEVRRLQVALELVAKLTREEADALAPARQRAVVSWALLYRQKGGALASVAEPPSAFPQRLLRAHLSAVTRGVEDLPPVDVYARALFLADLYAVDATASDPDDVEHAFELALAEAREAPDALDPARVLRQRARFRMGRGETAGALADYRTVLATEAERAAEAGATGAVESVLDLSDLRDAARLCGALCAREDSAGLEVLDEPPHPGETFDWTMRLVRRDEWSGEAVPVRMQDLRDLVERAAQARDPGRFSRATALFAGLPQLPPPAAEGSAEVAPPSLSPGSESAAVLVGLVNDRHRLEELHGLSGRLVELARAPLELPPVEPGTELVPTGGEATPDEPPEPAENGDDDPAHAPPAQASKPGDAKKARRGA